MKKIYIENWYHFLHAALCSLGKNFLKMFFLMALTAFALHLKAQNYGVNLVHDMAFVNVIDEQHRWADIASFDAQGWPKDDGKFVFDWRLVAEWVGPADDPEVYRINLSGIYKSSFVGQADVTASGASISNKVYNSSTNTTTFDITIPTTNNGRIYWELRLANTKRTASSTVNTGITKLRILRPGYDLSTTKIFNDAYINLCKSASFACYRFYNVNNVWSGDPVYPATTTWSNRKLPTDACQGNMREINGKSEGWSWEYVIQMANTLNKDIWINLNPSTDDNYVTQLATKLKNELNPNINIYVEYCNEVWSAYNNGTNWVDAQAKALGITLNQNYARNVVRVSNLFKNVFGATAINTRIRVVLGAQKGYIGRSDTHLSYINSNFGAPKNFIYAITPTTYYGGTGTSIEEALNKCHTSIMSEYDDVADGNSMLQFVKKANDWGLKLVSYEGNEHADIGNTANLPVDIGKHRDKRMATEQYINFKLFFDNGGLLACQFTLWSAYARYGCWGLTDDPTNPDRNFKFKAARSLCNDANGMTNPGVPTAPTEGKLAVQNSQNVVTWKDNAINEDGYEVWYKTGTVWKYMTTVGPNKTSAVITSTLNIETTLFKVRAYNFGNWSAWTNDISNSVATPGSGKILRQWWTNISGTAVSNLTSNINYPYNPTGSDLPTSFEAPVNWGDNYGQKMSGYLHPPVTGTYTFWISSDDNSELWLSTDENPANKVKIAYVTGWTSSRQWTKYTSQKSVSITLDASKKYYIEALHKEGGGGDNLAVAWEGGGITMSVIAGAYLDPATPATKAPGTGLTAQYFNNQALTGTAILTRTDATINFAWGSGSPDATIPADRFSARWTGLVEPLYSGTYTFYTYSDDGVRLWVNGLLIIDNWTNHAPTENSGTISLNANQKYDIKMEYFENSGGATAQLSWSNASQVKEIIPQIRLYPAGTLKDTTQPLAEELIKSELSVYPNPAVNEVNISNASEINNINVVDMSGKTQVTQHNHGEQLVTIPLNGLSAGMYIIQAYHKDGSVTYFKILKQ